MRKENLLLIIDLDDSAFLGFVKKLDDSSIFIFNGQLI